MFGHETVPADGSVTLPAHVRRAAGIEPGDLVTFRVTPERVIEIRAHRPPTLAEMLERFPIVGPIDEAADREAWQNAAAAELFRRMHAEAEDQASVAYPTERGETVEEEAGGDPRFPDPDAALVASRR